MQSLNLAVNLVPGLDVRLDHIIYVLQQNILYQLRPGLPIRHVTSLLGPFEQLHLVLLMSIVLVQICNSDNPLLVLVADSAILQLKYHIGAHVGLGPVVVSSLLALRTQLEPTKETGLQFAADVAAFLAFSGLKAEVIEVVGQIHEVCDHWVLIIVVNCLKAVDPCNCFLLEFHLNYFGQYRFND